MSALAAIALVAVLVSAFERQRRHDEAVDTSTVALGLTFGLGLLGVVATLLGVLGQLHATALSLAFGATALALWPWARTAPPLTLPRPNRATVAALVIVVGGLALRWPLADYPLAGRDQGTYTLRAQHTAREGRFDATDPVLADIEQTRSRPGPADLQGLYHRGTEPWRRDRYEASYRPGFYLADVDTGHIRPQFFHWLPAMMATGSIALGPAGAMAIVPLCTALSLLTMLALARRLWPTGPWGWIAAALFAVSPLVIWVQRTALTEGPATLMILAAALAVVRSPESPRSLWLAAAVLGFNAWIRGNGWLAAPMILAAQWLVPTEHAQARRAGLAYAGVLLAAVVVHAPTTYPYLHDELLRQLPLDTHGSPALLIAAAVAGIAAWFSLDELGPLRRRQGRALAVSFRLMPWLLAALLLVAIALHWVQRPAPIARPFSRLDPILIVLGPVALGLAALGLGRVVRRWPTAPNATHAWLLGLAAVLVATVGLYAQRNLPQLGLYYYARYLVPELVPAVLLLAVEGTRALWSYLHRPDHRGRRVVAGLWATAATAALGWTTAGILITHPVTRLQEFEGADRVVEHLAALIPEDAIVIAGGEGWHSGHTFNQVGGALVFGHGRSVVPYRDREAAYATLHELLIGRPAATGQPAPPVFLLLNEATKDHTRAPKDPATRQRIAALDDLLPPPFVARRIDMVEMFLQRLTPTHTRVPDRITRDGLRMALLRVEVDPHREAEVERWTFGAEDKAWRVDGRPGLQIEGGKPRAEKPCFGKKAVTITLPPATDRGAGDGPVSLVIVAAPGSARRNHTWKLEVDGEPVALQAHRVTPRRRDTLGPFVLPHRPTTIVLRGSKKKTKRARCPRGGLAELRLLGPDAPMLAAATTSATTFAPTRPLGHPVTPVAWVSGRGLSRHRPGITPKPKIHGLTLELRDKPLRFAPAAVPDGGQHPYDLILTLTQARLSPEARIVVSVNDEPLPPIDPPDDRKGSWQSVPITIAPSGPTARFELRLANAGPDDVVRVRDIGLFSRAPTIAGTMADDDAAVW